MTEQYELNYLVMPKFVYKDDRLTDIARRVYCFIHTYKSPQFFFSNDHMAEMFNCNPQTISNAIKLLQDLKFINTTYKVKGGGGKIRFIEDLCAYDYNKKTSQTITKRLVENEATTITKRLDNDTKDNNLKDENFSNKISNDPLKDMMIARKVRKAKKQPFGWSGFAGSRPNLTPKPVKKGSHAEDII